MQGEGAAPRSEPRSVDSEEVISLERALVKRAQAGDMSAMRALLVQHSEALYSRVILPRVGVPAAAEDLLRTTMITALEKLQTFRWQGCSIYFWLRQIEVTDQQRDEQLMLVLSSARSLHHQADLYLEQGEVDRAIATIRRVLELELQARWPAAQEVRLDAVARLAKLLLGQGEEQQALQAVDQALAGKARESFYLSNLHGVRGEILERRAERLRQEGQEGQAKEAARRAIGAFEQSIAINKRLQQALLQGERP